MKIATRFPESSGSASPGDARARNLCECPWIRYSGLSSSILISSRTTCFSFFGDVFGVKPRAQGQVGEDVDGDGKVLIEHFCALKQVISLAVNAIQHFADGIHRLRDLLYGALCAVPLNTMCSMKCAIPLRSRVFGARSGGQPDSHGHGAHMRHLLRHDQHAVGQFRLLDISVPVDS